VGSTITFFWNDPNLFLKKLARPRL
jgi:hypothetical protein